MYPCVPMYLSNGSWSPSPPPQLCALFHLVLAPSTPSPPPPPAAAAAAAVVDWDATYRPLWQQLEVALQSAKAPGVAAALQGYLLQRRLDSQLGSSGEGQPLGALHEALRRPADTEREPPAVVEGGKLLPGQWLQQLERLPVLVADLLELQSFLRAEAAFQRDSLGAAEAGLQEQQQAVAAALAALQRPPLPQLKRLVSSDALREGVRGELAALAARLASLLADQQAVEGSARAAEAEAGAVAADSARARERLGQLARLAASCLTKLTQGRARLTGLPPDLLD